mmetsp:Transcript_12586/g.29560  ORF Transcript_12586/g.29560 Transcript_12586/m.29560 type:complete len:414 (+) Transcript_12586:59-1300(+)|eukprot:CAMPEP_0171104212 /NCGR_PEP_ID=MMETSP0766_2-20121228/60207_1 /TAXON_ID=439317 /ORGANISM="Gambierdiscus australes, Strain CAWD 149" /LENGTH=413 /DNA_ID=CAMNT_0011564799 /DNA_START=55 /DNA_END=1296 /DNA_ORIENTATION=+
MVVHRRTLMLCMLLVVFCWLLLGMIVFRAANNCSTSDACVGGELVTTEQCGWTWEESFYYSVQTGFSIGFGLLSESNNGSRLYSVFHILMGSSIIGGILAFFVATAVDRHVGYRGRAEEKLAEYSEKVNADGYSGFTADQLRPLLCKYEVLYRDVLEKVEPSDDEVEKQMKQYVSLPVRSRGKLATSLLKRAFDENVEEMKGGRLSIEDIMKLHVEESNCRVKARHFVQDHFQAIILFGAFFLWIIIGIIYGASVEEWGFIQSLYFAVSTLSTAGLQGVTRDNPNVMFAAFFALVGVPLYGGALGSVANILVDKYNERVADSNLNSRLKQSEVSFVEHLLATSESDTLSLAEFIEVELLHIGAVDRGTLQQIKQRFTALDKDASGTLSKSEVMEKRSRKIARVKKQKAGEQGP